jgi:acetyl esterase/lipase
MRVKNRISEHTNIKQARANLSAFKHKVPAGLRAKDAEIGGVPGEWVQPAAGNAAGTLLYLHGGGYFACSPSTHRPITCGYARRGLDVFAPEYRLAPEHPFPAALEDAVAAYRGLIASGIPAKSIAVGGDSAGGGLALATLLFLKAAGDPMPAAAALFSPWTDLAGTGATLRSNTKRDAMFAGVGMERIVDPYLAGHDPTDPLASPLYGDLAGLPPLLLHAGSYEVLLDDSVRLAERAEAAGVTVTLRTWPVVPHVWQLFPLPEAAQSMDEAAAYLRRELAANRGQMAA